MLTEFTSDHWVADGIPAGGMSSAKGVQIFWQNGPLGRDGDRQEPNGAFVETVIAIVKDRLTYYQTAMAGKFNCEENQRAIDALDFALDALGERTKSREARKVEGTHNP